MSVKIYQGFRYRGSIHDLLGTVEAFRPWVAKQAQKRFDALIEAGMQFAGWVEARATLKRSGQRNPIVDTDFQVCVFPRGKGWIGIVYTEHDEWFQKWLKQPRVSEYGYWNNTDAPKGVSARAWRQRRQDWERALLSKGAGVPAMHGFTIDVSGPLGPMPKTPKGRRK